MFNLLHAHCFRPRGFSLRGPHLLHLSLAPKFIPMLASCLLVFVYAVRPCTASGLSGVAVASGLAAHLKQIFPDEPDLAVEKAVADGLVRALSDEAMEVSEVMCNRDYSQLCPSGWADTGDATTCRAPKDYQGKCTLTVKWGGLTPQQKSQQASKCVVEYPCVGQCTPDFSKPCPVAWSEDVNGDCLAPSGYTGRCVLRKSFRGMRKSEKSSWARACDVIWPCQKALQDSREMERFRVKGIFNQDCVADYSQSCPRNHVLMDKLCLAKEGIAGLCGLAVSSKYNPRERAAYAEACLTPWPCASL